ncbi:MAG: hypothetical protein Q8P12_01900, partial [bacterium]|nr:hypothetical protein [bacterium]
PEPVEWEGGDGMNAVDFSSDYSEKGARMRFNGDLEIREVFIGFPGLLATDSGRSAIRGTVCQKYSSGSGWMSDHHRNVKFNTLRDVLWDVISNFTATELIRVAAGGLRIEVRYRPTAYPFPLRAFVLSYPERGLL